jgi:hypothetical protein
VSRPFQAEEELACDFGVGVAVADEFCHLAFALGETGDSQRSGFGAAWAPVTQAPEPAELSGRLESEALCAGALEYVGRRLEVDDRRVVVAVGDQGAPGEQPRAAGIDHTAGIARNRGRLESWRGRFAVLAARVRHTARAWRA